MNKNDGKSKLTTTKNYSVFSTQVSIEVEQFLRNGVVNEITAEHYLNGAASDALDTYVSKEIRSADGIFFSGKQLSTYVASCISQRLKEGATVADPACGAGDLLLACALHFNRENAFSSQVINWGNRLFGMDLHQSFIDATKSRLTLLAALSCNNKLPATPPENSFHGIQQGDFLKNKKFIAEVDCIVMNPPFATVIAPQKCTWASGSIQLAGLFLATVVENSKKGQEIVAVLPDVLRSGSRYKKWREFIASHCKINKIHVHGRFDQKTDVDVFILHLEKNQNEISTHGNWLTDNISPLDQEHKQLSSEFNVSVGPFVPFREKKEHSIVEYLRVSDAIADAKVTPVRECHFNGTLHTPPFVVIRRTSNPADARRVIPTLVTGTNKIAVENHLIVITPKDKTEETCLSLMETLKDPYVDAWMNQAIRCRHLTTEVVRNLPLKGWK